MWPYQPGESVTETARSRAGGQIKDLKFGVLLLGQNMVMIMLVLHFIL